MPKLMFVSNSDRPHFSDRIFNRLKEYCTLHGYHYELHNINYTSERHISWTKLPLMRDIIHRNPQFDFYIWIDDDIYITNMDIPFETFLDKFGFSDVQNTQDVMISEDGQTDTPLNMGMFIIRKTAVDLLDEIWHHADVLQNYFKNDWEQDALIHLYKTRADIKNRILIVPHKTIQSFYRIFNVPPERHWSAGDFAAHITGMPIDTRIDILNKLTSM